MMSNKKTQIAVQTAIAGALALGLTACSSGGSDYVACHGVAKPGAAHPYVVMNAGLCAKLAGGQAEALPKGAAAQIIHANNYVKCYGVAAAGKNDCGTKTTACSGTINTARDPGAWVTALKGVCEQIRGSRVGNLKSKG